MPRHGHPSFVVGRVRRHGYGPAIGTEHVRRLRLAARSSRLHAHRTDRHGRDHRDRHGRRRSRPAARPDVGQRSLGDRVAPHHQHRRSRATPASPPRAATRRSWRSWRRHARRQPGFLSPDLASTRRRRAATIVLAPASDGGRARLQRHGHAPGYYLTGVAARAGCTGIAELRDVESGVIYFSAERRASDRAADVQAAAATPRSSARPAEQN